MSTRATKDELSLPAGLVIVLAAGLLFLLATAAFAVVPARLLPTRVAAAVGDRRDELLFVALCALGLSFALALLVAFVSS